jgi:hypothetical protein
MKLNSDFCRVLLSLSFQALSNPASWSSYLVGSFGADILPARRGLLGEGTGQEEFFLFWILAAGPWSKNLLQ